MNKKQQMQDILKDTIDYYNEDPANRRSVDKDGNCMYTWGNNHCAIGRYLKDEYQKESWIDNNMSVNELAHNADDGEWNIDWCLKDKAQGLDIDFWINLQDIHDTISCWDKSGLTDRGKEKYVKLIDRIIEGDFNG